MTVQDHIQIEDLVAKFRCGDCIPQAKLAKLKPQIELIDPALEYREDLDEHSDKQCVFPDLGV